MDGWNIWSKELCFTTSLGGFYLEGLLTKSSGTVTVCWNRQLAVIGGFPSGKLRLRIAISWPSLRDPKEIAPPHSLQVVHTWTLNEAVMASAISSRFFLLKPLKTTFTIPSTLLGPVNLLEEGCNDGLYVSSDMFILSQRDREISRLSKLIRTYLNSAKFDFAETFE